MRGNRNDVAAIQKEPENGVITKRGIMGGSCIQDFDEVEPIMNHRDGILAGEVAPDAGGRALNVLEERVENRGDPINQVLTTCDAVVLKRTEFSPTSRNHVLAWHGAYQMLDIVTIEFVAEANQKRRFTGR